MKMDLTKKQKHIMRELVAECYELHLRTLLEYLYEDFQKWGGDYIDSFELTERIHKFHNGMARDLYKMYVLAPPEIAICYAINNGVITIDALDNEIASEIKKLLRLTDDSSTPKKEHPA